jgi:RNA polymerase sigma-70 factor (ECF subfamily)
VDNVAHAARIEQIFREEFGRVVATLVRLLGDIDHAEEAVQDAFVIALERWPRAGIPANPAGWIVTTARNRAIDRHRRESSRMEREIEAHRMLEASSPDDDDGPIGDDRLRLIFTCCHPSIAMSAQVALTLRLVGGLETTEIARAFLVSDDAMAQRLVRAKRKIRAARIPYRIPDDADIPNRLPQVLTVIYLIYNEAYLATTGPGLVRSDLGREALRLASLLVALLPFEPETRGLLALLLLTDARRGARLDDRGRLVLLPDQDRSLWDRDQIARGLELVRGCIAENRPGPYQLQAAINAVHCDAPSAGHTDWRQILSLYDDLYALAPTPVVALNRAVAIGEVHGPAEALVHVGAIELPEYHLYHATRGDLLGRLGRNRESADAFARAAELASNDAERRFLDRRAHDARRVPIADA